MKREWITIKIDRKDYRRIRKWAAIRDMKIWEVISYLIKNEANKS